jgi:hypothetical protein
MVSINVPVQEKERQSNSQKLRKRVLTSRPADWSSARLFASLARPNETATGYPPIRAVGGKAEGLPFRLVANPLRSLEAHTISGRNRSETCRSFDVIGETRTKSDQGRFDKCIGERCHHTDRDDRADVK